MTLRVAVRQALSLLRSASNRAISSTRILYFRAAFPEIKIPYSAYLDKGVRLSATDGGTITLGKNVFLSATSQIISRGGHIDVGDDVHVGTGAIIVSQEAVTIGRNTLIAEFVVIRDQDHNYSARPIKIAGFLTGPITIGEDCWLGSKSTVLRNSSVGAGAIIGAHALVRGDVPPYTLAVGCPHKSVRKLPSP